MSEENKEELETSQNQDLEKNQEEKIQEDEFQNNPPESSDELSDRERQFLARAKKAEAKLKEKKEAKPSKKTNTESSLSREEAILYAKGYTDDEVSLANKLSKLEDIGVLEAIEDSVFKTRHEDRLRKEQAEKAELGASKGSGHAKSDKPIGQMNKDEHKEFFNKVVNQ